MPIKEYQCADCGHIQEELILKSDDAPTNCPHCESSRITVLPSIIGGYSTIGNNTSSVRPKGAGSKPRRS